MTTSQRLVRKLALHSLMSLALVLSITGILGCGSPPAQNSCDAVVCNQAPETVCSGSSLRTYGTGVCTDGSCFYLPHDVLCPNGCSDGRCVGDPCMGQVCHAPPPRACDDAWTLRTYEPAGVCSGGGCMYSSSVMACPGGCVNGNCFPDQCAGVTCTTPDANRCEDPSHLRVFEPSGTCGMGACIYQSSLQACPAGCENGHCKQDPCMGVTCTTPEANHCEGASLRVFDAVGTCGAGVCSYTSTLRSCAFGCENGHCKTDPCSGVSCTTPEANRCEDPSHLRVFDSTGSCGTTGACSYGSSLVDCPLGCANGHCTGDACTGVTCHTPDANRCDDATHLRVFDANGTCAQGACSYASSVTVCDFGCDAGHCISNPCTGVSCTSPDANKCDDSTHLRTYGPVGTCQAGACQYTSSVSLCVFGCDAGHCKTNPCAGVSCTSPTPNVCTDANHLRTYGTVGVCQAGQCQYTSAVTSCQFGCENGACKPAMCVAQSLKGSCIPASGGGACDEFHGSYYSDPAHLAAICPNYVLTGCSHASSVGGCLTQCGSEYEFVYYYPLTMTEAAAKTACTSLNGIWLGN